MDFGRCANNLEGGCWQSDWAISKCLSDAGIVVSRDLSCNVCRCGEKERRQLTVDDLAPLLSGRCYFAQLNPATCRLGPDITVERACAAVHRLAISHTWPAHNCSFLRHAGQHRHSSGYYSSNQTGSYRHDRGSLPGAHSSDAATLNDAWDGAVGLNGSTWGGRNGTEGRNRSCPALPARFDLLRDARHGGQMVRGNLTTQRPPETRREAVVLLSNSNFSMGTCAYNRLLALLATRGRRDVVLMLHGTPSTALIALARTHHLARSPDPIAEDFNQGHNAARATPAEGIGPGGDEVAHGLGGQKLQSQPACDCGWAKRGTACRGKGDGSVCFNECCTTQQGRATERASGRISGRRVGGAEHGERGDASMVAGTPTGTAQQTRLKVVCASLDRNGTRPKACSKAAAGGGEGGQVPVGLDGAFGGELLDGETSKRQKKPACDCGWAERGTACRGKGDGSVCFKACCAAQQGRISDLSYLTKQFVSIYPEAGKSSGVAQVIPADTDVPFRILAQVLSSVRA